MPAISPDHLLDQARKLITSGGSAPPREVDLRRAISNAYYSVFHLIATALADQFAGAGNSNRSQYGLVYRSLDHHVLAKRCEELKKQTPPGKFTPHLPVGGFDTNMVSLYAAVKDLQEKRHSADYDPMANPTYEDAALAIKTAESAIAKFRDASSEQRLAFLSLLAFDPR